MVVGLVAGCYQGAIGQRLPCGDTSQVCDLSRPFCPPVPLAGVNGATGNDAAARLSPDELTIFFYTDRLGDADIFMATRPSRTEPFRDPQPVGGVNTAGREQWPSVTTDGLAMYLEWQGQQVRVSRRATPDAPFSAASAVSDVNAGPDDGQPFVLPDESVLYFVSDRAGGAGQVDVYRTERDITSGRFGPAENLSIINSPFNDWSPTPSSDDQVLYFGSTRKTAGSKGNLDIWVSRRTSPASFDPPVSVDELNTKGGEWPSWLSPDGCRLYFTRDATSDAPTGQKVWVAERSR